MVWVAVVLTALFLVIGWAVVTLGGKLILGSDPDFQRWKAEGGRPYLDSLPSPLNPDSPATRGFVEPPSSEESVDGQ